MVKFKGKCEALTGHVFEIGGFKTIESFNKKAKEIGEYISITLLYLYGAGGDVKKCIEASEMVTFTMSVKPIPVNSAKVTGEEEAKLDLYK